jgi:hypothetical protein
VGLLALVASDEAASPIASASRPSTGSPSVSVMSGLQVEMSAEAPREAAASSVSPRTDTMRMASNDFSTVPPAAATRAAKSAGTVVVEKLNRWRGASAATPSLSDGVTEAMGLVAWSEQAAIPTVPAMSSEVSLTIFIRSTSRWGEKPACEPACSFPVCRTARSRG